jgi:16S rRNA (adenine1518-N6/adenine1519-N6)-dimethyltransferase
MKKNSLPSLLEETKKICLDNHITPSRTKGQNFLVDETAYEAMIEAAELTGNETVLEVGPGLGFLTERLASRAQKVYAVELDDFLAKFLQRKIVKKKLDNVVLFNEDILNFTGTWVDSIKGDIADLVVVANLPYNISSFFLRKFISGNESEILPKRLTLMLQKEVGERVVAEPGTMSILAVSVQMYTVPKITKMIPSLSFWPSPKIGSAVVTFTRRDDKIKELKNLDISEKTFFRLVKIGFSARRKMLKANLSAGLQITGEEARNALKRAGINENVRAQELSLENWLKLIAALRNFML